MYDYFLGGKDNFAVDRTAGDSVLAANPAIRVLARENRAFLGRAVRHLAVEHGIRQFVDIGAGLPTRESVHQVVERVVPGAHVVYVDHDPVVVSHSRALLADGHPGVAAVAGDLLDPASVLDHPETRKLIDPARPTALLMLAVLHFLPDEDDPFGVVAAYRDRLAPGGCLVLSYLGTGDDPEWQEKLEVSGKVYQRASQQYFPRTRDQVLGFFDGFELLEPGLSTVSAWRAEQEPDAEATRDAAYAFAGIGKKPG